MDHAKHASSRLHREANLLATTLLTVLCLYVAIVSILERPLFAPIATTSASNDTNANASIRNASSNSTLSSSNSNTIEQLKSNFISLFFLWLSALVSGRIFQYAQLPPLLGMLLAGMAFANVPVLNNFLVLNPVWNGLMRNLAFLLILLRCGIGLNREVLKRSLLFCTTLGLLPTGVEVVAIVACAHLLFKLPLALAILFGFVLASTSPAVTVPTMIQLQKKQRGTDKGVPTMVLASACLDNIFCISCFAIAFGVVSASAETISRILLLLPVQLLAGFVLGCLFGALLRLFPSPNAKRVHFQRVLLLCASSMALHFGLKQVHFGVGAPFAVILSCFVAASGWKEDNSRGIRIEAEALRVIWDLLLLPLLFVLIGLLFDFSAFTPDLLEEALLVMSVGMLFRAIAVFLLAKASGKFVLKECLFLCTVFVPKATVQAALAPLLLEFASNRKMGQFTMETCILSILLTAPVGQLLIQQLGNRFLTRDESLPCSQAEIAAKEETKPKHSKHAVSPVVLGVDSSTDEENGIRR